MPRNSPLQRQFESAVDQYADSLFRVAFRLTGQQDRAVDLVQETYLQAWRGLESLRDPAKLRGWMFGILRNQYLKSIRQEVRMTALANERMDELAGPAPVPQGEARELIQTALEQLDDEQRMPIVLVAMEGIAVDEAAEILGLPRGTVLSRLHRGRQRLREIVERQQSLEASASAKPTVVNRHND